MRRMIIVILFVVPMCVLVSCGTGKISEEEFNEKNTVQMLEAPESATVVESTPEPETVPAFNVNEDIEPQTSDLEINSDGAKKIHMLITDWVGWKPIIDANGGLETSDGSIYAQMGLDLTLEVIQNNVFPQKLGEINALGCTVREYTDILENPPEDWEMQITYIPSKSDGWNLILGERVEQLVDLVNEPVKIGFVNNSDGEYMFYNSNSIKSFLMASNFTNYEEFEFATEEEAFKSFNDGNIDLVCLSASFYYLNIDVTDDYEIVWNDSGIPPYESSVYGLVAFNNDLMANKALSKLFIYGALKAAEDFKKDNHDFIRMVLPSAKIDESIIKEQLQKIEYINYDENRRIIDNEYLYSQMDGEGVIAPYLLRVLHAPFSRSVDTPMSFSIDVYFESRSPNKFINMEYAKSEMDKVIDYANDAENKNYKIKVIGYVSNLLGIEFEKDKILATGRAQTVYDYFIANGIDEERLLPVEGKYGNESLATQDNASDMRKVWIEFYY